MEEDYDLVPRVTSQTKIPEATCIVLDGAVIIQMMKPAAAKTFREYAHFVQQVFIPYISSKLRMDLIWDTCKVDSLKGTARVKRGNGVRRHVIGKAGIQ